MKALIYARVSTSHHNQNPQVQIAELKRACEGRGWAIHEEIIDHGYSGSTDNRPGLRRLMALVRAKEVDVVVVVKMDRLFRSLKHLVSTLEDFEKIGVKFVALKDNVDYSTPSGRFFVQILGSLGEFERSLLRERTMMGLEHARTKGKKFGRPRIHNDTEIRRLHQEGKTYRQIQNATGAPMGTISRAIKSARKSQLENALTDQNRAARNTTVLRAGEIKIDLFDENGNKDKLSGKVDS
ncbi:recombinase family protein [Bdellovibrio sp. KM01]|uniref:recombinase family protein n=1 Tax=Bdellovibrio sp. KM01 TaxID=2748865 RepID=UPI0015EABAED|nr:recombinase family protein [Bdellovibrio sp. KM01]QLY25694.1 recombinase family protein [Bdellovibrio sp. KM01]